MKPLVIRPLSFVLVSLLLMIAASAGDLLEAACGTEVWSALGQVPSPCRGGNTWFWYGGIAANPYGLRYDPPTNICSTSGAQSPLTSRNSATIVQAGSRILVWGGSDNLGVHNDGALYDIATDQWTPVATLGAPAARDQASGVWTGTEVLIWGGSGVAGLLGDGGAYDPAANTWRPIPSSALVSARRLHAAIWTGTEMVVYGGSIASGPPNTGGRLEPVTMTWRATSMTGAPDTRYFGPTVLGAGTKMIVTGGYYNQTVEMPPGFFGYYRQYRPVSHIYDAVADTWTSYDPGFSYGEGFSAVWTGQEAIFWGGAFCSEYFSYPGPNYWHFYCDSYAGGKRVDEAGNVISVTSTNQPEERYHHSALWADSRMLLWGGSVAVNSPPVYFEHSPTGDAAYEQLQNVDVDGDGYGSCQTPVDCDDTNAGAWETPGEATPLTLTYDAATATTTLSWPAPPDPGGLFPTYDVLRSITAYNFAGNTLCVESNGTDLTAIDTDSVSSPAGVDYYLVRARNQCPGTTGSGAVGFDSTGAEKSGRSCP